MNDSIYLSPEIRVQIQEFYKLPPEGLTDEFLDKEMTLDEIEADLDGALKYPTLAQAARTAHKGSPRLKTRAIPGRGKRVALYLTTRRWVWQAIESGRLWPRWKD